MGVKRAGGKTELQQSCPYDTQKKSGLPFRFVGSIQTNSFTSAHSIARADVKFRGHNTNIVVKKHSAVGLGLSVDESVTVSSAGEFLENSQSTVDPGGSDIWDALLEFPGLIQPEGRLIA